MFTGGTLLHGHHDARHARGTADVRSLRRAAEPDVTARQRSQTDRDRPVEGSGRRKKSGALAIPKESPRGRSRPTMRFREQQPPTSHRGDRSRPTSRMSDRPEPRPRAQELQSSPREESRPPAKMRKHPEPQPLALEPPEATPDGSWPPVKTRKRAKSVTVTKALCDR